MKKIKTYDKEFIAKRLNQIYGFIRMHPEELVTQLMLVYHQMQLRDITLQNRFMELASDVQTKEEELAQLQVQAGAIRDRAGKLGLNEGELERVIEEQREEQFAESSLGALKQTLGTVEENNSDFSDKSGNFIFGCYLFLTETIDRYVYSQAGFK